MSQLSFLRKPLGTLCLGLIVAACGGPTVTETDAGTGSGTQTNNGTQTNTQVETGPTEEELAAMAAAAAESAFEEAGMLYAESTRASRPYDRIHSLLDQVLETNPEDPEAWFNKGSLYHEQGDIDAAIEAYEQAGAVDELFARGMAGIGSIYLEQGNVDQAVSMFRACVERSEIEPGCNINLAMLYMDGTIPPEDGRDPYDLAIEHLRFALGGDAMSGDAYANLARIYSDQGQLELARLVCENAILTGIDSPVLHNRLGLIALELDDVITAYQEFSYAIAQNPDYVDAHMNVGAMALSFRDYDTALESFSNVLEARPDDVEVRLSYGAALRGIGDLEGALAEYERVIQEDPSNAAAIYNIAVIHQEEYQDYTQACTLYHEFLANPNSGNSGRYEDVTSRLENLSVLTTDLADFGLLDDPAQAEACVPY